jgi:asparagine synthase (glutamine-hydrolysing)
MFPQHRLKLVSGALRQANVPEAFFFCRSIAKDFDETLLPDVVRRTVSMRELFAEAAKALPAGLTAAEVGMRLDTYYTLPDGYLQKVDLASMAFSLESRDPLLDQDLIEWAFRLPMNWKLRSGQNKYLLRRLAYRYVPREILDRPKKGFEVPVREWLKDPLQPWAESRLHDADLFKRLPLNHSSVLALARTHNSGRRNAHPLLWAVLMLLDFLGRVTPCSQRLALAGVQSAS